MLTVWGRAAQPLGCVAPIDSPQAEPCADLTQDQRKLTEAELRARLRQEKAEAKKVDLDELVEKVAGEDRRDPYKELAKNPSSLVSTTTILVIVAQRTLSGVVIRQKALPGSLGCVASTDLDLSGGLWVQAKRRAAIEAQVEAARAAQRAKDGVAEPSEAEAVGELVGGTAAC